MHEVAFLEPVPHAGMPFLAMMQAEEFGPVST